MLQHDAPHAVVVYRDGHAHAQFIRDPALQKEVRPAGAILQMLSKKYD